MNFDLVVDRRARRERTTESLNDRLGMMSLADLLMNKFQDRTGDALVNLLYRFVPVTCNT